MRSSLFSNPDLGSSAPLGIGLIKSWLQEEDKKQPIRRIVDFGCGNGLFFQRIKRYVSVEECIGVELWAPSIARMLERGIYSSIIRADMRDVVLGEKRSLIGDGWDLWLFGDCLEHIPKEDAIRLLNAPGPRLIAARIPIGPWPQEAGVNNAEEHLWSFYPKDLSQVNRGVIDWAAATHHPRPGEAEIPYRIRDIEHPAFELTAKYIGNILFGELIEPREE